MDAELTCPARSINDTRRRSVRRSGSARMTSFTNEARRSAGSRRIASRSRPAARSWYRVTRSTLSWPFLRASAETTTAARAYTRAAL